MRAGRSGSLELQDRGRSDSEDRAGHRRSARGPVFWATTFIAFRAKVSTPGPLRLLLELIVFGLAIAALYTNDHPGLAWTLGLVYAINRVLMYVWGQ